MDTEKIRGTMKFYAMLSTENVTTLGNGRAVDGKRLKNCQMFSLLGIMMAQGFIMLAEIMIELFNIAPADVKH